MSVVTGQILDSGAGFSGGLRGVVVDCSEFFNTNLFTMW